MGLGKFHEGGISHYEWFNLSSWDDTVVSDNPDFSWKPYPVVLLKSHEVVSPKYKQPTPMVTLESKPMVTLESKPMVTLESKPMVTLESKPMVTLESGDQGTPVVHDPIYYPWIVQSSKKVLIVDLGNLRAKPPLWAIRMKLVLFWASQADHIFIAGQSDAVKLALPHLDSLKDKIRTINLNSLADKYLLSEVNKIQGNGLLQFLVMSNDHIFSQLARRGPLLVATPKIDTMSKVLKVNANIVIDIKLAQEAFIAMPDKFVDKKVKVKTSLVNTSNEKAKTLSGHNRVKKNNFNRKKRS